ncbi:MAG TPA: S-adenosylmethionine:tRNA ribosyltransferase-isomerase, partial [Vicinamibacterales bacterium]
TRIIGFATITHAAGISSTGDPELDMRLPFDEPYDVPASTARAIERAQSNGGRIIAIGTTVVRALEHSAMRDGTVRAGPEIATERVGPGTRLRVVDAILTGVHERGTSHYELLRAFADDVTLSAADEEIASHGYRPHEFGDSVLVIPSECRIPALCPTQNPKSF